MVGASDCTPTGYEVAERITIQSLQGGVSGRVVRPRTTLVPPEIDQGHARPRVPTFSEENTPPVPVAALGREPPSFHPGRSPAVCRLPLRRDGSCRDAPRFQSCFPR